MGEKEDARKFTLDVGWATLSLLAMMGTGFILSILLGNYFDAEGLGTYSMVLTLWSIASLVAGIGIPLAVIKFVAQYQDSPKICNSIISSSMLIGTFSGLATSIILFLLSGTIERYLDIPDLGNLLRIVSISFPFIVNNEIFLSTLNAYRKMKSFAALEIFRRGGILIITLVFIWAGMGVEGAVLALVVAPALTTGVIIVVHKRYFKFEAFNRGKILGKISKFGGQLYAASIIGLINAQAAIILIGLHMTVTDVGVYTVALMFFNAIILIPQAIQKITYPAFAAHIANKRKALLKKMIEYIMRFSFVLMCITCLFLIFYYDDIIVMIFPGKDVFLDAVDPLIILAIVAVPLGIITPIGAFLNSAGRADLSLKISIAQVIANVGLAAILIPSRFSIFGFNIGGLNGAALAIGANCLIGLFFLVTLLFPVLKISINFKKIYLGMGIFFIHLLAYYILVTNTDIDSNIIGAFIIPLFLLSLYVTRVITNDLINMFLRTIKSESPHS